VAGPEVSDRILVTEIRRLRGVIPKSCTYSAAHRESEESLGQSVPSAAQCAFRWPTGQALPMDFEFAAHCPDATSADRRHCSLWLWCPTCMNTVDARALESTVMRQDRIRPYRGGFCETRVCICTSNGIATGQGRMRSHSFEIRINRRRSRASGSGKASRSPWPVRTGGLCGRACPGGPKAAVEIVGNHVWDRYGTRHSHGCASQTSVAGVCDRRLWSR
jgi:hypothetical protein